MITIMVTHSSYDTREWHTDKHGSLRILTDLISVNPSRSVKIRVLLAFQRYSESVTFKSPCLCVSVVRFLQCEFHLRKDTE